MNEDTSTRYRRRHRQASILAAALAALVLILFVASGGSAALRDALGGSRPWVAMVLYVVVLTLGLELVQLPLGYYRGMTLERRYGLSTQPTAGWWLDQLKSAGIGLVLTAGAMALCWGLIRWSPDRWWMAAAAAAAVLLAGLAVAAPVVLLPLFYDFRPLGRAALVARLEVLAARAGARVLGVFEWRLEGRTRKANAALAGIGRTRRILVSDTLLAAHSDDEIEVILAHELGHHVHGDIWSSLALESVLIGVGLYAADRALAWSAGLFGLAGKGDIAALPVLLLAAGAVSVMLMPAAHALSRAHERRADRYALDLTGNAASFISAMKRLGAQNLAEERPTRVVEMLFYSHPPMMARIEAAREYERESRALRSSADRRG